MFVTCCFALLLLQWGVELLLYRATLMLGDSAFV